RARLSRRGGHRGRRRRRATADRGTTRPGTRARRTQELVAGKSKAKVLPARKPAPKAASRPAPKPAPKPTPKPSVHAAARPAAKPAAKAPPPVAKPAARTIGKSEAPTGRDAEALAKVAH